MKYRFRKHDAVHLSRSQQEALIDMVLVRGHEWARTADTLVLEVFGEALVYRLESIASKKKRGGK